VITNHGISSSITNSAWKDTQDFFDMPLKNKIGKQSELLMTSTFPYGYSPFGGEVLSKGKVDVDGKAEDDIHGGKSGDMKEMFSVGPYLEIAEMPLPRYPAEPSSMSLSWRTYFESMEGLSAALMRGFALALDLHENWFETKTNKHASSLRALNYPTLGSGLAPKPGQLRASAHTDYGVLTILKSGGPGFPFLIRQIFCTYSNQYHTTQVCK